MIGEKAYRRDAVASGKAGGGVRIGSIYTGESLEGLLLEDDDRCELSQGGQEAILKAWDNVLIWY